MNPRALLQSLLLALVLLAFAASVSSAFGQLDTLNPVGGGPSSTQFQLDNPGSIVRNPDGTFLVLEGANDRVVKLSAAGEFVSAFGGRSHADSGTYLPSSLTLDTGADPDIFVSTAFDGIKRFSSSGAFEEKFGAGTIQGSYLAIDPSCGELYVSQLQDNRVTRHAIEDNPATPGTETFGTQLETIGQGAGNSESGQPGKLWGPRGVAFDSTGRVFVVDRNNHRISVFKWTGNCDSRTHAYDSRLGSNSVSDPAYMSGTSAVAVDNSVVPSKIYVTTDYLENLVQAYTGQATGEPLPDPGTPPFNSRWTHHGEWGSTVAYGTNPGSGTDDLFSPEGILVSGSQAWVTESGNGRVHAYSGVSAETPFTIPTTTGLWGTSPENDGYFRSAGNLAATADGGVWIVDRMKARVQRFSARGEFLAAFGQYGTGNDEDFQVSPNAIAVTPGGEVLITGSGNVDGIKRYSSDGAYLGEISWAALGAGPIAPGPIDLDAAGNIFTWDYDAQKLLKLDLSGNILTQFGSSGTGANDDSLYGPTDIAVAPDGLTVFVLDGQANRLKKFVSADGVNYGYAAVSSNSLASGNGDGQLSGANAIALDPSADLLVTDAGNDRVQRFAEADLSFVGKFGTRGFESDQLIDPSGVGFDRWGNMWLADSGNDRIKRFGEAPQVTIDPIAPTSAATATLSFQTTDPASDCDRVSGANVALVPGANNITVTCSNAQGSGSATVNVTRTVPPPPAPPAPTGAASLKLAGKLKLAKTLRLKAICPAGCTITAKLAIGGKKQRLKKVVLTAGTSTRSVTLRLSAKQVAAARKALKAKRRVTLDVSLTAPNAAKAVTARAKLRR